MTDKDLARFVAAQDPVIAQVNAELAAGRKHTHWMWFVFPQLVGLGLSDMAQRFAIDTVDQARRYLADPVLGERLRDHVGLLLAHGDQPIRTILGSPDDLKLRSCLTLFRAAATAAADVALFEEALRVFYAGEDDPRTRRLLAAG